MQNKIQLFEKQPVRAIWDEENEKWWLSVMDVVGVERIRYCITAIEKTTNNPPRPGNSH